MPNILWNWYPQYNQAWDTKNPQRKHNFIRLTINDLHQLENWSNNFWIIEEKRVYDFIWRKFEKHKGSIRRSEIEEIISRQQREEKIEDWWILLNIKYTLDQIWLNIMRNKLEETRQWAFDAIAAE